jgi:hypothetical protein
VSSPSLQNVLIDLVLSNAARATLPFQEAEAGRNFGTAFWYNDLVESTGKREVYRQYLVTAADLTAFEMAQWTVRAELGDPAPTAGNVLMMDFAARWTRLGDLGVAVMPAGALESYAKRKGFQWATDEITDGLAAGDDDSAAVGAEPVPAYVLGHDVGAQGERQQAVIVGAVARDVAGRLRWDRPMPVGCVGAPVFVGRALGEGQFKLVCLGVVLPGDGRNEIASFDRIRPAVRALAPAGHRPWWRRRPSQ